MSNNKNPYSLERRKSAKAARTTKARTAKKASVGKKIVYVDPVKSKVVLDAATKQKLLGFRRVKKEKWRLLPLNSIIKYINKEGVVKPGGKLVNHGTKGGQPFLYIWDDFHKNNFKIFLKDIRDIYARESEVVAEVKAILPNMLSTTSSSSREVEILRAEIALLKQKIKEYDTRL